MDKKVEDLEKMLLEERAKKDPKDKKVEEMSELEIKAAIFDQLRALEQIKLNIEILKQELSKREKQA